MEEYLDWMGQQDKLSQPVHRSLRAARLAARELGHPELGPLHLLFALLTFQPELLPEIEPASVWKLLERMPDGGNLEVCHPIMVWPRVTEKHLLLAAFEQGAPGAIMLRALGSSPELLLLLVRSNSRSNQPPVTSWLEPQLPDPPDCPTEWAYLTWLVSHPDSLGSRTLEELGLSRLAVASWVARERPDKESFSSNYGSRTRHWAELLDPEKIQTSHLLESIQASEELVSLFWARGVPRSWPGAALARELCHVSVEPLHLFLAGLNQPRFQLPFYQLRQECRRVLESWPTRGQVEKDETHWSEAARLILSEAGQLALSYSLLPHPLMVSLCALTFEDPEIARAVPDPGPLLREFKTLLWGELPEGVLQVDGVQGQRLTCDGRVLLDESARLCEIERLVGIARVNRWIRRPEGWLRINMHCGNYWVQVRPQMKQ